MAIFFFSFMLLGVYGLYWKGQREFNRRNAAGVQEYDGYFKYVFLNIVEGFAGVLSVLAIGLGFALGIITWASNGWLAPFDKLF